MIRQTIQTIEKERREAFLKGVLIGACLAVILWLISTATQAEEGRRYNAQDTLRRAQVGTYSPRLAPPVNVETKEEPAQQHRFERLRCYVDPVDHLRRTMVCESKDSSDG